MTSPPTRIEAARRRVAGAKKKAVAAAAAGFLVITLLARESHPGQASGSATSPSVSSSTNQSDDTFGFDSGSVSPSTATPDAHSSVS